MPPAGAATSNAVLLDRIEGLRCDTSEIKATIAKFIQEQTDFRLSYKQDQSDFRLSYEQRHAVVVEKVNSAHSRLDDADNKLRKLDAEVEQLRAVVAELKHTNKLLAWLGGIAGGSIILWFFTELLRLI